MAAGAEHDCHVRKEEPSVIIFGKVIHKVPYKSVVCAGQHHANRKSRGMGRWSYKFESSQGSHASLTYEIEVENSSYMTNLRSVLRFWLTGMFLR